MRTRLRHIVDEERRARYQNVCTPADSTEDGSQVGVPLLDGGLPGVAADAADLVPGDLGGTQASHRVKDGGVEDLAQLQELSELLQVTVGDALASGGHDAGDHTEVIDGVDGAMAAPAGTRLHSNQRLLSNRREGKAPSPAVAIDPGAPRTRNTSAPGTRQRTPSHARQERPGAPRPTSGAKHERSDHMWTRPRRGKDLGPFEPSPGFSTEAVEQPAWPSGEYALEPPREVALTLETESGGHETQLATARGRRRRRSLYAAVRAVELEWREEHEIRRGTLLLTFTTRSKDAPEQAQRKFWHWYDQQFGRPHIAWLEAFADNSGWHYHAIVPDAPQAEAGHSVAAIQAAWAHATGRAIEDVNVDLSWLPKWKRKGKRGPVAYALAYAKKSGPKAYQQEYDDAPLGLHTVLYTRLTLPAAMVLRLSLDVADFLQTMALDAVQRPSRHPGGGWLLAVRRRSAVHRACWLRVQVLREVDLARGVVRTLGLACEADESHPPPGSVVRRRLTARRALTRVTDFRQAGDKRRAAAGPSRQLPLRLSHRKPVAAHA